MFEFRGAQDGTNLGTLSRGTATLRELTSVLGLLRAPLTKPGGADEALVKGLVWSSSRFRVSAVSSSQRAPTSSPRSSSLSNRDAPFGRSM